MSQPATFTMTQTRWEAPAGYPSILTTLGNMALAIVHTAAQPKFKLFSNEIVARAKVAEYDQEGEVRALWQWVRTNIRYTRDPAFIEWLQTPLYTLLVKNGDCDCQTMLLGSMLATVGYPVRLILQGRKAVDSSGNPTSGEPKFYHVFLSALFKGTDPGTAAPAARWRNVDPTVNEGFKMPFRADAVTVYKSFNITPDGKIVEAKQENATMNAIGYSLGNFLGDFFGEIVTPKKNIVVTVSTGKRIPIKWALQDLRHVTEAQTDTWMRQLADVGVSARELAEIPVLLSKVLSNPAVAAQAGMNPNELSIFTDTGGISGLGNADDEVVLSAMYGMGGFFKSMGKTFKKIGAPLLATVAAPFTGGASLLALGAMGALKKKKASGGKLTPQEEAQLTKAEAAGPRGSVEITQGEGAETPEVKSSATKKYLIGGAAIAAVGGGAYALSKRN